MKKYNIGFIGCGKMAGAIIKGLIESKIVKTNEIIASQLEVDSIKEKSKELNIEVISNNVDVIQSSNIIFLAVKPNQILNILKEISQFLTQDKLIVSIAAGVTTKKLEDNLPSKTKVIRVMPNTPALLGSGMSGLIAGKHATQKDLKYIEKLFNTIGKAIIVENEHHMDIITAISGSGPAFFYKIINDIARAGENLGLDYEKSLLLSIQTALGSAKMALNSNISMEQLISNVATKGGCTRVGVDIMEKFDTKDIFNKIISETAKKAAELG